MAERKAILSGVQEKEPEEGKNSRATNAKSRSELDTSLEDIPPLQIRPDDPNKIFKGRPMYLIVRILQNLKFPACMVSHFIGLAV